jgi:magnesium chelatase family protein
VVVPPVSTEALLSREPGECSAAVRERVTRARHAQTRRRAAGLVSAGVNGSLTLAELELIGPLDARSQRLLARTVDQLGLSARGFVKVRRLARTIADLEGAESVRFAHVAEAVQLRILDRR